MHRVSLCVCMYVGGSGSVCKYMIYVKKKKGIAADKVAFNYVFIGG